jgi:hypothetical protein
MMLPEGHSLYPGHPDLRGFVRFINLSTSFVIHIHLPLLDDHVILNSVGGLLLLHHDHEEVEDTWPQDQDTVPLLHRCDGEGLPGQPDRKLINPSTLSLDSLKL